MKNKNLALKLTESAMMIALATILSLIKVVDLPYGGSITIASSLPILIIAYRHGTLWGLFTGLVYGTIQLLFGMNNVGYATSAMAAAAIIFLDYIIAYGVTGFGGMFRKLKNPRIALTLGGLVVSALRYACHVTVGCTVWAGLSIPTAAALKFSLIYNATYLVPDTIILLIAAYYLAGAINFKAPRLTGLAKENGKISVPSIVSGGIISAALIYDVFAVFSKIQGESGFDITMIGSVNWTGVLIVTAAGVIISGVLAVIFRKKAN